MEIITAFFNTVGYVVTQLLPELIKAVFNIKDSVDTVEDSIVSAATGIPVWVIAGISTAATITLGIIGLIIWFNKKH